MKQTLQFIFALILIICLNSCKSESIYDLNELLEQLNTTYEYNLVFEDFTVTKDDFFIYSTVIDKNLLLCFYCNNQNEIIQCTITTDIKPTNDFEKMWQSIGSILTSAEIEEIKKISSKNKVNGWNFQKNENDIGTTIIINRYDNPINSNNLPAIKEYIDENKITRPINNTRP